MRGDELIAEYLIAEKVPYVFGTPQWNRGPFQETYRHHQADFPAVIRPYVKRAFQVPRAEMLPLAPIATGTWQLPPLPHPEPNYPALVARPANTRP